MKNALIRNKVYAAVTVFLCFCFSACDKYDFYNGFYRPDQVNQRSSGVEDISSPDVGMTGKYSVIIFSDVHFGDHLNNKNKYIIEDFFRWLNDKSVELSAEGYPLKFACGGGDFTDSGLEKDFIAYKNFTDQITSQFSIPVYNVVGNHDLYNNGWQFYKKHLTPHKSSYRFITSDGAGQVSWYFLDTGSGTLGNEQFTDLKQKMTADPNKKVVISHFPVNESGSFYFTIQNLEERDELISMFAKNNVAGLVTGHFHPGDNYSYGNYFTEYSTGAFYKLNRLILCKVDSASGEISFSHCFFR